MSDSDKTFDVEAVASMMTAARQVMAQHNEIRSMAVIFDYKGKLSQVAQNIVWVGPEGSGAVATPEAVIGSMQATLSALAFMFNRAAALEQVYRDTLHQLMQTMLDEAVKHHKENNDGNTTDPAAGAGDQRMPAATGQAPDAAASPGG